MAAPSSSQSARQTVHALATNGRWKPGPKWLDGQDGDSIIAFASYYSYRNSCKYTAVIYEVPLQRHPLCGAQLVPQHTEQPVLYLQAVLLLHSMTGQCGHCQATTQHSLQLLQLGSRD
jgi:hypothetical protein